MSDMPTLRIKHDSAGPGARLAALAALSACCAVASLALATSAYAWPNNETPPTISGTAQQGRQLSEGHGKWNPTPTSYTYQWRRCSSLGTSCLDIAGATGQTYTPVAADVGGTLIVQETAHQGGFTSSPAESKASSEVLPAVPANEKQPVVSGTAQQGQTIIENHGTWGNSPTGYGIQWLRCNSAGAGCVAITGAINATYVPGSEDVGHTLRAEETASNAGGSGTPSQSEPTSEVLPPVPANEKQPVLSGTAQQGHALTESHGSWSNGPTGYGIQWLRCNSAGAGCVAIAGATGMAYVPDAADVGHTLRAEETASNAGGSGPAAQSEPTMAVRAADDPPARVVIAFSSIAVEPDGDARIPLSCPATASAGCRGTIAITLPESHRRRTRAAAAQCARGCRDLVKTHYEARVGQKISLRVHIASFRRQLGHRKFLAATLVATSVSGGQSVTVTRKIKITPRHNAGGARKRARKSSIERGSHR